MATLFNCFKRWSLLLAATFAAIAMAEDPLTRPGPIFLSCAGNEKGGLYDTNFVSPETYLVGSSDGKLLTWILYQKNGQLWSKAASGSSAREEYTHLYLTYEGYTDDLASYIFEVGKAPQLPFFLSYSNLLIDEKARFELTCFHAETNPNGICGYFGLPSEGPVGAHGFVLTLSPSLADSTAQDKAVAPVRASRFVKSLGRLPNATGQPVRYKVTTTQSEITKELQQEVLERWCNAKGVDRIDDTPDVSP